MIFAVSADTWASLGGGVVGTNATPSGTGGTTLSGSTAQSSMLADVTGWQPSFNQGGVLVAAARPDEGGQGSSGNALQYVNYVIQGPWRGGNLAWAIASELSADTRVQAFLGTLAERESGGRYDLIAGGGTFSDFSAHPNVYVPSLHSTAAGAYQFIKPTWNEVSIALGLTDFTPRSQDLGAIHLLNRLGAIDMLLLGNVSDAIFLAGRRWDAFPINASGLSISGGNRPLQPIVDLYREKCKC